MLHAMLYFLSDECLHTLFEFTILYLLIEPFDAADKVAFAGREYRVQRIHEVRHERIGAKPMAGLPLKHPQPVAQFSILLLQRLDALEQV